MRITSKGQITIPQHVRQSMGLVPAQSEVEFEQDEKGRWYIVKPQNSAVKTSRFRTAHQTGQITMSTEEIMALTRGESWRPS